MKPCFFFTFNITTTHIFPKHLLKFLKLFRKYEDFLRHFPFLLKFLQIFINFSDLLTFLCYKKTNGVSMYR